MRESDSVLLGLIRHALTVGGGYIVATGAVTDGQVTEAVGAIVALIGIAWSVYNKYATTADIEDPRVT